MNHLSPERLAYLEAEESDPSDAIDEQRGDGTDNHYREAAQLMLSTLYGALAYIKAARTHKETSLRVDVACWYFCHPSLIGKNLTAIAAAHGRGRATTSAQLAKLEKECALPSQIGQKLDAARKKYQEAARKNRTT